MRTDPPLLMPMVVDHAVPSEVQSTVGSEWNASPGCRLSVVCPQVVPLLVEKNCACTPEPLMLFEALMIFVGSQGLTRMSDSLRGAVCRPEMRCSRLVDAVLPSSSAASSALSGSMPGPGCRSWWLIIHSRTSRSTSGYPPVGSLAA